MEYLDELQKSHSDQFERIEDLWKGGKPAQIGETRLHGGKKMKKTSKGWELVKEFGEKEKKEEIKSKDIEDSKEFESNGFNIYPIKFRDGKERWAIQSIENKNKGVIRGGGDSLFNTKDEAVKESVDQVKEIARSDEWDKKEVEKKNKEADAEKLRTDTFGFADSLPPREKGKAIAILNKNVQWNSKLGKRKDLIKDLVENKGYKVKSIGKDNTKEDVLQSPDGGFLDSKVVTKVGLGLAKLLENNKLELNFEGKPITGD